MAHNFAWFVIGCFVSWLAFCALDRYAMRPRDHSKTWQQADQDSAPWLQHSLGRKIGPVLIFTPPGESHASAVIYPAHTNGLPGIYIQDEDQDGSADEYLVADSSGVYVSLTDTDADGTFDNLTYNVGSGSNSFSVDDGNMDGIFDQKLGPGRHLYVNVKGNWHELQHDAHSSFITVDGARTQVTRGNNVWTLSPTTQPD
jgi:hypothetical protein